MALLLRIHRFLCSSTVYKRSFTKYPRDEVAVVDAVDEFTDGLLSRRQLKWEIHQQKQKGSPKTILEDTKDFLNGIKRNTMSCASKASKTDVMFLSVDFKKLNVSHIDHLVLTACRDENKEFLEGFVGECVSDNKEISANSVLTLCEYFSIFRDNRTLLSLIELCKLRNRPIYDENNEFNHYVARSLWAKGNSDGALSLIDETYPSANAKIKKSIRFMFRFLIEDTVDNKSEAVLVRLIKSAVLLEEKQNEPMVLAYIWKTCFLSGWFSDQVMAVQLFGEYPSIRSIAAKRSGTFCYSCLCSHNLDAVHRLIEMFLKHNMIEDCKLILELLFEYHYVQKDLRACSEILKTTLELDINLSSTYNHKLLNLLMGGTWDITRPKKNVIPKFDFKF